jgi:hypothetical protein
MKLHGAILACFLAPLALAGSSALGAVALNCDLSDCGIGRDAHWQLHAGNHQSGAPAEQAIHDRIEELKGFIERLFSFDTSQCRDDSHEHGFQAPHCGFPADDRKCVGVIINCQKLCGTTGPHVAQNSDGPSVALVDDSAATDNAVSPTESSPDFVAAADPQTVPAEANPPPQSESDQPGIAKSDSNSDESDVVQDDSAKPTVEFASLDSDTDSSTVSPQFVPPAATFDPPAPGPFLADAALPVPFTASVSTDSFGPVAYEGGGSQSANPEPASIVIWAGMAAIALGIHTSRRRRGCSLKSI